MGMYLESPYMILLWDNILYKYYLCQYSALCSDILIYNVIWLLPEYLLKIDMKLDSGKYIGY